MIFIMKNKSKSHILKEGTLKIEIWTETVIGIEEKKIGMIKHLAILINFKNNLIKKLKGIDRLSVYQLLFSLILVKINLFLLLH